MWQMVALMCSLVPRLLFTDQENSLVNYLYHLGATVLKSLVHDVNWIVKFKIIETTVLQCT